MGTPLQVLLVEDNAGDARLLREMFRKEKPDSFKLTHLLRMSDVLIHLEHNVVDIVLLDLGLPDGHGLDTVRRVHAMAPGVPVIVLTGMDDEKLAAEAMKEGAQDYLIKGQIENRALPRVLRHAIERHRMQTEAELLRKRQIQFKDEFLSHVSHELRSPLTAIYQFVTVLLDGLAGGLNREQGEYLQIVLTNVKQLQSMIDDLLEVTRLEGGRFSIELQRTSLSVAVSYVLDTLGGRAKEKGVTLSAGPFTVPMVCADPMRVRQILIILVDNAIKFTPSGGTVAISAKVPADVPDAVVLEVRDSGNGIAAGMTEQIFERLFQASDVAADGRMGLGLGLHICRELVTRLGGRVWAENSPDSGAILSVALPVYSLASLLAPAVRNIRRGKGALTLVTVRMVPARAWHSDAARAEFWSAAREVLQSCLHSEGDTLLPKMGATAEAELFFIVARTDAIGGEAIAIRIREELQGATHAALGDATVATTVVLLSAKPLPGTESLPAYSELLAIEVQERINEHIAVMQPESGD